MREIHEKGSPNTNMEDHFKCILKKLYIPTVPCIRKYNPPMKKPKKPTELSSDDNIYQELLRTDIDSP